MNIKGSLIVLELFSPGEHHLNKQSASGPQRSLPLCNVVMVKGKLVLDRQRHRAAQTKLFSLSLPYLIPTPQLQ